MFELSVSSAHVVCLVYAVDDWNTFKHVATLRDLIIKLRPDIPIVVVGNKIDLDRKKEEKSIAELVVECDWDNDYVECSAKMNIDVEKVFLQIFKQVNIDIEQSKDVKNNVPFTSKTSNLIVRRRKSLSGLIQIQMEKRKIKRVVAKVWQKTISSSTKVAN
jgi:GTPase SAR1 family protein